MPDNKTQIKLSRSLSALRKRIEIVRSTFIDAKGNSTFVHSILTFKEKLVVEFPVTCTLLEDIRLAS